MTTSFDSSSSFDSVLTFDGKEPDVATGKPSAGFTVGPSKFLGVILPRKDPQESVVMEFVFDDMLGSIASAVLTVTPVNGTDANAADMLTGTSQIIGTKVYQRLISGLDKVNYRVRCAAAQTGGDTRVLSAILPVRNK